jgi:hypothetical protein
MVESRRYWQQKKCRSYEFVNIFATTLAFRHKKSWGQYVKVKYFSALGKLLAIWTPKTGANPTILNYNAVVCSDVTICNKEHCALFKKFPPLKTL